MAGPFIAACSGIFLTDKQLDSWPIFGALFCLFALFALIWRKTAVALAAVVFFFAFWHSFRIIEDQGFQLSREPRLNKHVHHCVLCAQSDSTSFHWANQTRQRFYAEIREVDGFPVQFRASTELTGSPIEYGDAISVDGRFTLPEEPLNPGEFDYRNFLKRQSVYLILRAIPGSKIEVLTRGGANPLVGFAVRVRHRIEGIPIASLEDDPAVQGLIRGILFGDRSTIPAVIMDELQDTGTLHLFVIDGLKMTLLAGISWAVLRVARLGRRWTVILIVPLLLYCAGTGLSIASLRATIMSAVLLFGVALERPVLAKNVLSGAGLFLVALDPQQLFQLGFQLSFVTVAALTIATKPLADLFFLPIRPDPWIPQRLLHPVQRSLSRIAKHGCELLAVCFVCWWATLPFAWLTFHRISWCSVAANFVTVPLGASMLALGISSILAAPFCRWVSLCLNNTNWLLGHLFLGVVHIFTAIPLQSTNAGEPGVRDDPKLVILASGRSNSIYLHSGAMDSLINPGSEAKYRRITQPFLRYQGVNRLCLVQSSRHDADHEGCLKQLERQFSCVWPTNRVTTQFEPAGQLAGRDRYSTIIDLNETGIHLCAGFPDRSESSILVRMGGYLILLMADSHRGSAWPEPDRAVDLLCVSSPRSFPPMYVQRSYNPQVLVYAQGRRSELSSQKPTIFLSEEGAVTLQLCGDTVKLQTFRGGQFIFRKRN
ncbi:MAG TPA: ComEC/Rec2 family competence protein [Chthoniobacterales bacterium]|nr:ComEC/Rec2 family competence protein [Chthoniobacterales bacterium]